MAICWRNRGEMMANREGKTALIRLLQNCHLFEIDFWMDQLVSEDIDDCLASLRSTALFFTSGTGTLPSRSRGGRLSERCADGYGAQTLSFRVFGCGRDFGE